MINVIDTGCGIPQELMDKVFEPFFTTKEVGTGSGLGLSMVYGFVKQSRGHVRLHSEVGAGTSVRIHLPRGCKRCDEERRRNGASRIAALPRTRRARDGETVLLVEDNEQVRRWVFRRSRIWVTGCSKPRTGTSALRLLEERRSASTSCSPTSCCREG
jgi:hypothetical protein